MNKTNTTLKCSTTHGLAIRAAAEFPEKLFKVHGDKIQLRDSAVYDGCMKPIDVACNVCQHEWSPIPSSLLQEKGCPECAKQKNNIGRTGLEVVGKQRQRRSTPEERHQAKLLYEELGNYTKVAEILGRGLSTILQWLSKDYKEKHNARSKAQTERDRANGYRKERAKTYLQTDNGKIRSQKGTHKRRALEYHCADIVFLPEHQDANHQGFVSYDIWDLVEPKDFPRFTFNGADDDVASRKIQQEKLSKISGEKYSLEHLIPLSRGGIHCPENFANRTLVLNIKKHNKRIKEDDELFCQRLFNI